MDTTFYREFIVLAEILNFGRAADALNMTQSNLSKHIRAMEAELGEPLFERRYHPVELSSFGKQYLPYAIRIQKALDEAAAGVENYHKTAEEIVMFGGYHNIEIYGVEKMLVEFMKANPPYKTRVYEAEEKKLLQLYQAGKINIITDYYMEPDKPQFPFVPIGRVSFVAVIPPGHRLAGRSTVHLSELADESLMIPNRDTKMGERIYEMVKDASGKSALDIVYEGSSSSCLSLVKNGRGIALQPEALPLHMPGTVYARLEPAPSFIYGATYRNSDDLTKGERILIRFCDKVLRNSQIKA